MPQPTGGLKKLKELDLCWTQVTDAGCAALVAALNSGLLPALEKLHLGGTQASAAARVAAARVAVREALAKSTAAALS